MTTTNGSINVGEQIEGLVESANDHGIKVGGEWRNVSKFGKPIDLPDRGARVRLDLDAKGFIRTLEVLSTSTPRSTVVGRDATITHLAVLKAASNFLGLLSQTHEEVRSEHVLVLADKWLAWVHQSSPEEPEF